MTAPIIALERNSAVLKVQLLETLCETDSVVSKQWIELQGARKLNAFFRCSEAYAKVGNASNEAAQVCCGDGVNVHFISGDCTLRRYT